MLVLQLHHRYYRRKVISTPTPNETTPTVVPVGATLGLGFEPANSGGASARKLAAVLHSATPAWLSLMTLTFENVSQNLT